MLRIIIELFPQGRVKGSKIIATGKINQIANGEVEFKRDYEFECDSEMDGIETSSIKDHDRRNSPWELLRKLLNEKEKR